MVKMIDDKLIEQISRHEGTVLSLYKCSAGKLTIGTGHNIEDLGISQEVSDVMLGEDLQIAQQAAESMDYYYSLNNARQGVITNMVFNMGMPTFLKFKNMNAALNVGDYEVAADEMKDSVWYVQVGDRGRELEAQMRNGEYAD